MPRHRASAAIALCSFLALCACNRADDRVVATVDGTQITASELAARLAMERTHYDQALLTSAAAQERFRKQVLEKLVQETLLLNEAKRRQIAADESPVVLNAEIEKLAEERGVDPKQWRRVQRQRALIDRLVRTTVTDRIPITEEEIARYYRQHVGDFRRPAQFMARQILVDDRAIAEKIHAELAKGADFGELAQKYSQSPDSERGGELGYFDGRSYPPVFADICRRLKVGETSDVIKTDYGFQIFQLQDRRPAKQQTIEEVAPVIRAQLQELRSGPAVAEWFRTLAEGSETFVDWEAVQEVQLASNRP